MTRITFKKIVFTCIVFISSVVSLFATHQRAAEISYTWVSGLTFEVTITMYTYTPSMADDSRFTLPILWGDNSTSDIPRIVFTNLPDNYSLNIYRMNHTFPAAGTYKMSVEDPNRNFGVVNIPNSVNVPMYVESQLVINPFLGNNNSVSLLNPPIDQGCVGSVFVHNAAAYDADGDSLSFHLVDCRGLGGLEIPGFVLPVASNSFSIDSITGDLVWDAPVLQGEYNVAFIVEEWRHGVKIGYVTRDMQIVIGACSNNPPQISSVSDTCVIAGDTLNFVVQATDPDGNGVNLTANGGPFEMTENPATINPDPATGTPTAITSFGWFTTCSHIRKTPFVALFRARDAHPVVSLTSLKSVQIQVIAPPVLLLSAIALGSGVDLSWDTYNCDNAIGFKIYRRSGSSGFSPDPCQTGVPSSTGFRLVAEQSGTEILQYRDDDHGEGLVQGIEYCYLVTAFFQDGAESIAGNEICVSLKRDLPVMTHVSNDSISLQSGHVITAWSKPTDLDTMQFPGPYYYTLQRYESQSGIGQPVYTGSGLNDTLFTDESVNMNTSGFQYYYDITLGSSSVGTIGSSRKASSVFLALEPTDGQLILHWKTSVPWINDSTLIYRKKESETVFAYVGKSITNTFIDKDLTNEATYCYYVKTMGGYSVAGIVHPIINYSQIQCGIPLDNIPPCTATVGVITDCETVENLLHWHPFADSCGYDLFKYLIYYKANEADEFLLIDSVFASNDTSYLHQNLDFTIGCYYIKSVDIHGNISLQSNTVCVDYDACPPYKLPNVFTPNSDQINDIFLPIGYPAANPKAIIESVKMAIFNRWGKIMFETNDPEIKWDGKNSQNGLDCSEGVYFYTCEVYFVSLNEVRTMHLQGSITIIR
ncbi:MAG: T9SS type B sorting domain-containing protein [Bacteroidales bacterium]|nr:T9SS type B sorting domain-containing protein [Bacteroidales bacterium]